MSAEFLKSRNEFLEFFPNCTGSSLYITPKLLKSESAESSIHSALWKYYLLIAPNTSKQFSKDEDWIRILKEKRSEFFALRDKHFIKAPDADDDQESLDPLLAGQSKEWSQFFADQDLRKQIRSDTARAFQELEFFQNTDNQDILEDLLFLFCRTHPSYGYPQGLHELCAFIFFTFHEEMTATQDDVISFIFNENSVVPDAYFVFSKLAEFISPFYTASEFKADASDIAVICEGIQTNIIGAKSPQLAGALNQSGIQPHTYMMKWLRLLFLSVFDFNGVRTMWDIFIAFLPNINIIKNTCAMLLLDKSSELVQCDSTELLTILFHYPAISRPWNFVIEAVELENERSGKNKKKTSVDIVSIVAERLNELSRGLNEICSVNGYELAMPYVMDLRRTRDILLGILPIEEMMPLEMAVELFKPQKVEYKPVEVVVESFDKDNRISKKEVEMVNNDLFTPSNNDNTDLFGVENQPQPLPKISSGSSSIETNLLFAENDSTKHPSFKGKRVKQITSKMENQLFGETNNNNAADTLFEITGEKSASATTKKSGNDKVMKIRKNSGDKSKKTALVQEVSSNKDDPLEVSRPPPLPTASSTNSKTKTLKSTTTLFDDDDDILFAAKPTPKAAKPKKPAPKSTKSTLFDDDDDLLI